MSRARANPIFVLVLVFLLAGDLGSQIFADANHIECSYWWARPTKDNGFKHQCAVSNQGIPTYYECTACKRGDGKSPTADNCIDPNGRPLSTTGSFSCDGGVVNNPESNPDRPIICYHLEAGVPKTFHCKTRHLNQQCPTDKCTER
ncbi:secreted protein [Melampsora americana]|nr:secreted protein [Melampsora americana]